MKLLTEKDRKRAIADCQEFHRGQFDRQGAPYWLHPYRVALHAESFGRTQEERDKLFITGLFHDVAEDTDATAEELLDACHRDWMVFTSIVFLTKPEVFMEKFWDGFLEDFQEEYVEKFKYLAAHQGYDDLIARLCVVADPDHVEAIYVKYCDNVDNSHAWRAKPGTVPGKKYVNSKKMLEEKLELA